MAEYLHFSLTGDLSLLLLWELQSPCCSAVDRLLPANLIWTQQMVHRDLGTEGSESGGAKEEKKGGSECERLQPCSLKMAGSDREAEGLNQIKSLICFLNDNSFCGQ